MPTCLCGWWLNTTPTWTSTTCGPGLRSHCRGWCPSIASDAAILHVPGQNGTGIQSGDKTNHGAVYRANLEFELPACGHAPERFNREAEVRSLAPGSDRPVWRASKGRRGRWRQGKRPIIEDHGDGGRCMNIPGLPVIPGGNVYPQAVAQGAAAIPFDRAQVGETGALAQDEHGVLRPWHEFNRFFERPESDRGPLVQDLDGLGGRQAGTAGLQSNE